jgi:hypothetical protein
MMKKRGLSKQACELPDHPDEFDALIQAGKESPHRPLTKKVLAEIWQRGRSRDGKNLVPFGPAHGA